MFLGKEIILGYECGLRNRISFSDYKFGTHVYYRPSIGVIIISRTSKSKQIIMIILPTAIVQSAAGCLGASIACRPTPTEFLVTDRWTPGEHNTGYKHTGPSSLLT